ncbi:MAG TPA: helix-turn-helix transcriptional regulator [Brevundimonas sp.]|nr:helix-turn-helix transcriptional regulator [Brevundimonas sp.]
MPRFESDIDARRLGEALAALRREQGLSQAEAGRQAGMTSQGWGLYESGRRPGLFRPDVQRRLTQAIGTSPEALALAVGTAAPDPVQPLLTGVESAGRTFDGPPSDRTPRRRLQLSNDDLAPWAASGVTLEYQPGRWPRRDQGCVIETADGQLLVRLYDRADAEMIVVRGGPGGLASEERIARASARSVSAVTARLEG